MPKFYVFNIHLKALLFIFWFMIVMTDVATYIIDIHIATVNYTATCISLMRLNIISVSSNTINVQCQPS